MPSPDREPRGRPAKVGHRKSRLGCMKCKTRRVKCDEVRPVCGNCTRLKMDCSWPDAKLPVDAPRSGRLQVRPSPSPRPASALSPSTTLSLSSATAPTTNHPTPDTSSSSSSSSSSSRTAKWPEWLGNEMPFAHLEDAAGITLPESKARRLMEHRLMHNYYRNTAKPFPIAPAESWTTLWSVHVPALGLRHENVMYAMLASSATSLLASTPDDKDLFDARQGYFISALHAQRHEVVHLTAESAEPACFAALLISMTSFAMLKERSLDPYQPPIEWLQVGRGAGAIIWMSVDTIMAERREADHPALMTVATAYPYFGQDQSYFAPDMRKDFAGVLTQHLPSGGDDWADDAVREAYEKTLSYVGSIQRAIHGGEPTYAVTRRLQTFALLVPPTFITLLSKQRPRALVIMAHFWATVSQVHGVWWLGESDALRDESTAKREISAIKKVLPPEWMTTMVWPLDQVGLRDAD